MKSEIGLLRLLGGVFFASLLSLGTACTSPDEIRRPCCYEGVLVLSRLERVQFVMNDGSKLPFDQVFEGFEAQKRDSPTPLPFQKVNISGLVYDVLSVVLPNYDANKNGFLEAPELTVLYLREGALGEGFKVSHLIIEERVRALQTSDAEIGGLVTYVNTNRSSMTKDAQALFREIDYLGVQVRKRGPQAADQTFLGP